MAEALEAGAKALPDLTKGIGGAINEHERAEGEHSKRQDQGISERKKAEGEKYSMEKKADEEAHTGPVKAAGEVAMNTLKGTSSALTGFGSVVESWKKGKAAQKEAGAKAKVMEEEQEAEDERAERKTDQELAEQKSDVASKKRQEARDLADDAWAKHAEAIEERQRVAEADRAAAVQAESELEDGLISQLQSLIFEIEQRSTTASAENITIFVTKRHKTKQALSKLKPLLKSELD